MTGLERPEMCDGDHDLGEDRHALCTHRTMTNCLDLDGPLRAPASLQETGQSHHETTFDFPSRAFRRVLCRL